MSVARSSAATVLIDFASGGATTGTDGIGRQWNTISGATDVSGSPHTLLSSTNTDSGYRLSISNPPGVTSPVGFGGENTNGTQAPSGDALARNYPISATRDSFYGSTSLFSGNTTEAVRITLTNLNPGETYSLTFFASRIGAGGDNRETEYNVTGGNLSSSVFLNASENTGNTVTVSGVTPNGSNSIVIDIDRGPNNTNGTGFYYLNVLEIVSVPEPTSAAIIASGLIGFAMRRRRQG